MIKTASYSHSTCRRYAVVVCCLTFLCACASNITQTQYYVLQPLSVEQKIQPSTAKLLRVGLVPLWLPEYINHSGIVSLSGPNQFNVSKKHVWAGDLDREILRVLNINLNSFSGNYSVLRFPWSSDSGIDYLVRIHVDDFVGNLKSGVELRGQFEIIKEDNSTSASMFTDFHFDSADIKFDSRPSASITPYQNYVLMHSQLLLALADLINRELGKL